MSILKVGMYASQLTAHGDKNYLTFSSDAPFSIKFNQKRWDGVLEYSVDAQNWYTWDASEISSAGNVLYLRGLGNAVITNGSDAAHAMTMTSTTGSGISCAGNIMTLLDHASPETAVMGARCFASMFYGCTNLTTAPELPATALAERCYSYMFWGCTSLTTAPELPATALAERCYSHMFWGCTNIRISSTQTDIYQNPWRIPTTGTGTTAYLWNEYMLYKTGAFVTSPAINTTYYQAN